MGVQGEVQLVVFKLALQHVSTTVSSFSCYFYNRLPHCVVLIQHVCALQHPGKCRWTLTETLVLWRILMLARCVGKIYQLQQAHAAIAYCVPAAQAPL